MSKAGLFALWRVSALFFACFLLTSCAGATFGGSSAAPELSNPDFERTPPPVLMPETGAEQLSNSNDQYSAMIDISNVANGYVAASCTAPGHEVRLSVQKADSGDRVDNYLTEDGSVEFFPLTYGDGYYQFFILIVVPGTTEATQFLAAEANVTLSSEFAPFIVPNRTVDYTPESSAVALSYEVSQHASSNLEVLQQVYAWVQANVSYDEGKATTVVSDLSYTPSPDATVSEKTGICYDYAALTAAMLRANGIPCKLVKGYVADGNGGNIYHAWNMVWTEEDGWIAVEVPATKDDWERIDLTFAASGRDDIKEFVGDGSNYAPTEVF